MSSFGGSSGTITISTVCLIQCCRPVMFYFNYYSKIKLTPFAKRLFETKWAGHGMQPCMLWGLNETTAAQRPKETPPVKYWDKPLFEAWINTTFPRRTFLSLKPGTGNSVKAPQNTSLHRWISNSSTYRPTFKIARSNIPILNCNTESALCCLCQTCLWGLLE